MPELPEVETICQSLSKKIIGKKISKVIQNRHDLRINLPTSLKDLVNFEISSVKRRAKFILISFKNHPETLVIGLGMTGRMLFNATGVDLDMNSHEVKYAKHNHVIFEFSDQSRLIYNDIRRFGFMLIAENIENFEMIKNLGPEPLSEDFNSLYFSEFVKKRQTPIKNLLMSNDFVVGIGNIYASESLFNAQILPYRPASSLSKEEIMRLITAICDVLKCAIEAGGSSLKDYVNAEGQSGYFQHKFKVYGKNKCSECESEIKKIKQAGRSSFFCPNCQV